MSAAVSIDLNADCGEGIGNDAALIPLVTSANLACGFHAGDPDTLRASVRLCRDHGVAVGAQPSLPDRDGFGRRELPVTPDQVHAMVLYQIGAVAAFCRAEGVPLVHVKPHGALYNMAARDRALADAIAAAAGDFDPRLVLFGLAGSALVQAGRQRGLRVAEEAFVDRRYRSDGLLVPRGTPGALIDNAATAIAQALAIARHGRVTGIDGDTITLRADTLCLHGDGPHAVAFASQLREAFLAGGIEVRRLPPENDISTPDLRG